MLKIINMWKDNKRNIKEVNYREVDLSEYIIIDVRSKREFREKHLEDSINIPLQDIKRKIELCVRDKNKKILVCCEYGTRSARAVKILEELGYLRVYNLKGGLENI